MECPSREQIHAVMRRKGYALFDDKHKRGYDLNLVGVRSAAVDGDAFDDWITVSYLHDGRWVFACIPATTDPGTYWRRNPERVDGVAILKPGQYRGLWTLGKHRGEYDALVQAAPCEVYRDANRDGRLDTEGRPTQTGVFGINLHHASRVRASTVVDKWSAGCQVVADPAHFDFLLALARLARAQGPTLTYTLLTQVDFAADIV